MKLQIVIIERPWLTAPNFSIPNDLIFGPWLPFFERADSKTGSGAGELRLQSVSYWRKRSWKSSVIPTLESRDHGIGAYYRPRDRVGECNSACAARSLSSGRTHHHNGHYTSHLHFNRSLPSLIHARRKNVKIWRPRLKHGWPRTAWTMGMSTAGETLT